MTKFIAFKCVETNILQTNYYRIMTKINNFFIFFSVHSDFRPSTLEKVQEKVRLRIYQAYSWGVPAIIMAIAIILDNIPNGDFLRPQFGQTRCGFDG